MDLKYISQETLTNFIVGMSQYETTKLINDPNVLELLDGKKPKDHRDEVPLYKAAEAFLYLFQEREDYELCQRLIEKWPNLKNN